MQALTIHTTHEGTGGSRCGCADPFLFPRHTMSLHSLAHAEARYSRVRIGGVLRAHPHVGCLHLTWKAFQVLAPHFLCSYSSSSWAEAPQLHFFPAPTDATFLSPSPTLLSPSSDGRAPSQHVRCTIVAAKGALAPGLFLPSPPRA